jgi:hypothetical protein
MENKPPVSLEDEGEIGELKMKYSNQLRVICEMFPDWTQEDLVFALQETNGDIESTIERITEGETRFSKRDTRIISSPLMGRRIN